MTYISGPELRSVRTLPDAVLAQRLCAIRGNRRAFDKITTDAILEEAERRLRWGVSVSAETGL